MLFPFPLELFPFPFPLVAQNYSHSHGNPMGIYIPMHTSTVSVKEHQDTHILCPTNNEKSRAVLLL